MEQLTIGQVAQSVGLRTSTLRYYESIGLLPPASPDQRPAALFSGNHSAVRDDYHGQRDWIFVG